MSLRQSERRLWLVGRAMWRTLLRTLLRTRRRTPLRPLSDAPLGASSEITTRAMADTASAIARRLPTVGSPRGEAPEYGVRLAALALAEALRRLQLDSGFLMCCYSGVWAQPVRHELLVLAHAVDELAVSASVLPIGAAADLARAVGLWKAFHAVASSRSMLEPEPAQPGHWAATTTPRDLLVACREELERFGHGAFAPPDAGHGRLIG